MDSMFQNSYSLESLDLSNFNTENVESMKNMFYNCYSLKSLDLSNFNTIKANSINEMFTNCSSLQYINLFNYLDKDIFSEIANNSNLEICINDLEQINKGKNSLQDNNVIINCKKKTPPKNAKISLQALLVIIIGSVIIIILIIIRLFIL